MPGEFKNIRLQKDNSQEEQENSMIIFLLLPIYLNFFVLLSLYINMEHISINTISILQ